MQIFPTYSLRLTASRSSDAHQRCSSQLTGSIAIRSIRRTSPKSTYSMHNALCSSSKQAEDFDGSGVGTPIIRLQPFLPSRHVCRGRRPIHVSTLYLYEVLCIIRCCGPGQSQSKILSLYHSGLWRLLIGLSGSLNCFALCRQGRHVIPTAAAASRT
ncbi:hypothetical protein M438DRAFT_68605 [Aureobasidium pullulans EXF-150]|uniref:Uncharacterized protein n=1 Tax=Aureobasidium pullulans EXF-150 TaxID=1043002 RepID=A0A074XJ77_AURPU|nr:uncharacterized protein M438DRAFT_68605 [Aureobasidium pullulans EXF-150]KEQ82082.1 hypothetical protein M438DRAFT_68605 [Aureobasidium pullulans EXF-150]